MKQRSVYILLGSIAAALCLAACSQNDSPETVQESPVPQFSARAAKSGDECTYPE